MNKTPLISIMVTCYNNESTVIETLESINKQTYQNWECIIVDDCSQDNTVGIVNKYIADNHKFRMFINENNTGHAKSLNKAAKHTKGDFIIILDSDDVIHSECLKYRVNCINEDLDFWVFPSVVRFTDNINENVDKTYQYNHSKANYLKDFITCSYPTPWQTTCVMWEKQTWDRLNGQNEKYPRMVDVEIASRALILDLRFKVQEEDMRSGIFYRIVNNDILGEDKRQRFFIAALIHINEIKKFTIREVPEKWMTVKKYLFCFFLSILCMTITSKQFSDANTKALIGCAEANDLITNRKANLYRFLFANQNIQKITKLPLVRGVVFRITKLYIKSTK